jgi:hypothetical protein
LADWEDFEMRRPERSTIEKCIVAAIFTPLIAAYLYVSYDAHVARQKLREYRAQRQIEIDRSLEETDQILREYQRPLDSFRYRILIHDPGLDARTPDRRI